MKRFFCAVALGALVLASRAGAAEFGDATKFYEDDAWYDVTEWFDGNDYNPTDEAWWRWDNESYELARDTSGDADNDLSYGFDGGLDDDWYYDYYDPYAYSYLGDPGVGGVYDFASRYYDYDRDGVYDAYASYSDLDGDGLYDDYDYYSFNTVGEKQQPQGATGAAAGSSRQTAASGRIRQMKLVDVGGGRQHVVVAIAPRSGKGTQAQGTQDVLADLGEKSALKGAQLGLGKTIAVTGPRARRRQVDRPRPVGRAEREDAPDRARQPHHHRRGAEHAPDRRPGYASPDGAGQADPGRQVRRDLRQDRRGSRPGRPVERERQAGERVDLHRGPGRGRRPPPPDGLVGEDEAGHRADRRRVDPLVLANDERRIETLYRLRGYYSAEAEHELEPTGRDRVRVVFRIREGAPTRVERVERTGVEALPPEVREAALASLPIGPGDVLRYEAYDTARERVEARLRAAGYAKAEVDGRLDVYPERHEAVVTFQASPGALHRYGDLRVEGLAAIPADPLLAIVRRVLPRGQPFSPRAFEEAQSRLSDLGAFRTVRLSMGAPPEGGGLAPVVLRVEELPIHSVVLGGGVGVEQSVQQIRALVEYGNTSFLGGARRLSWENELSLRFLPSFFERDRTGMSAESTLELTQPEILDRTSLGVRAGYARAFHEAYEANVVSARVGLGHRLARGVWVVPALSLERFLGFSARTPAGAAPLPLVLGCPEPCQLTYVSLDLIVDHRDNPVATRRGHLLEVGTRYGFPLANGGFHYVRVEPEARWYAPLGRRLTLATRAKLGALFAVGDSGDSPLPHRFFGGGEGGHRGFGAERLAPIVEDASGGFVPIGGDGLWLVSAELRFRASTRWELVSFADWGDVTVEPLDLDPGSAHLALGGGARLFTPVGPVRLDVSYRAPRRMRIALDTGAAVETRARDYLAFFLSIGEAF